VGGCCVHDREGACVHTHKLWAHASMWIVSREIVIPATTERHGMRIDT
jgi:hypothetical protein